MANSQQSSDVQPVNARVMLNPEGYPVAFRRVVSLPASGPAREYVQLVTPAGIRAIRPSRPRALMRRCQPLN